MLLHRVVLDAGAVAVVVEHVDGVDAGMPQPGSRRAEHRHRGARVALAVLVRVGGVVRDPQVRRPAVHLASVLVAERHHAAHVRGHVQVAAHGRSQHVHQALGRPGAHVHADRQALLLGRQHPRQQRQLPPLGGAGPPHDRAHLAHHLGQVRRAVALASFLEVHGVAEEVELEAVDVVAGAELLDHVDLELTHLVHGEVEGPTEAVRRLSRTWIAPLVALRRLVAQAHVRARKLPARTQRRPPLRPVLVDVVHAHARPELHAGGVGALRPHGRRIVAGPDEAAHVVRPAAEVLALELVVGGVEAVHLADLGVVAEERPLGDAADVHVDLRAGERVDDAAELVAGDRRLERVQRG